MNAWSSPLGYKYAAVSAGFRKQPRNDLGLIVSDTPALVAAMFTTNLFAAAPVLVGKDLISKHGWFRAIMFNSGQANASTGEQGIADCRASLQMLAAAGGFTPEEALPGSTGVIGAAYNMGLWSDAIPKLVENLGKSEPEDFARAIMTTDRFHKIARAEVALDGGKIRILGMAKGAGMICPNMATMLSVLLCDARVDSVLWKKLVSEATEETFNRVTVDGDTSTNDTLYAMANGASGVTVDAGDAAALKAGMVEVLGKLAYMLVEDGEGATKVMHIKITGASNKEDAEKIARTIGHSQLVKTAMYGQDANWGRIIAALGRSGVPLRTEEVVLTMCGVELFRNNLPCMQDDDPVLVEALKKRDIDVELKIGSGAFGYTLLASDLTHKYVDINADYRS